MASQVAAHPNRFEAVLCFTYSILNHTSRKIQNTVFYSYVTTVLYSRGDEALYKGVVPSSHIVRVATPSIRLVAISDKLDIYNDIIKS